MNNTCPYRHLLGTDQRRINALFWQLVKVCAGIAVAAVASWLIVVQNDLTALFFLAEILVVVHLLDLPEITISAFYSGALYAFLAFFFPQILQVRGVTYSGLAIAGSYLAWQVIHRNFSYKLNLMFILHLIFTSVVMLSMTQRDKSILAARTFFISNTGAFLVTQALAWNQNKTKRLLIAYGLFSLFLGFLSYQELFNVLGSVERIELWGRNAILVGRWAGRGLLFALLGTVVLFRQGIGRWICLIDALILTPIIIISNQRGVLISIVLAICAAIMGLLWTRNLDRRYRALIWIIGLSVLVGLLAIPFLVNWGYRYFEMLEQGLADPGFTYRQYIFRDAWAEFLQNPILGSGFQGFEATRGYYAHNIFLEIMADLGLMGLALFVSIIGLAFYYATQLLRDVKSESAKPYMLLVLALLVFDLGEAQVSANIGTNNVIWFDVGAITALYLGAHAGLWEKKCLE